MSKVRKIAMFGGTFNPPHKGHIEAAKACVKGLELDMLYLVPANIPPHKQLPQNSATAEQRLHMARLAAEDIPNCTVWDVEMHRCGKSYTYETVEQLRQMEPKAQIWLIIGTDMLESFDKWKHPEKIIDACRLGVVARFDSSEQLKIAACRLEKTMGAQIDIVENPVVEISSTDFRTLYSGELLTAPIWDYIEQNNIYIHRYNFEMLHSYARQRMSDKRYNHVLGCEKVAMELALKWGENVDDSRAAAILHDVTKNMDIEQQLIMCKKYGIITNYDIDNEKHLFHADTSAAVAQHELGMPCRVADAICSHTLGKINMSTLGKIIYLADMIEPNREYPRVEDIRRLSFESLDDAVIAAMERKLEYSRLSGRPPNIRTAEALKYLKKLPHLKG